MTTDEQQKINEELLRIKQEKERNKVGDEYKEYRKQKLLMTIDERAKDFTLLKLIMFDVKTATKEFLAKAEELQRNFFTENPKRIFPDPIIFKELLEKKSMNKFMVDILFRLLQQDMFYAK